MNVADAERAALLLQQRKNLLMMQLSASDADTPIEVKIDGKSHEFPAYTLTTALRVAITTQLRANSDELGRLGCIIKE